MKVTIEDDSCWICGTKKYLTTHHCLPKHLKPKKNVLVQVCDDCHQNINAADLLGISSFLVKTNCLLYGAKSNLKKIKGYIEKNVKWRYVNK